MVFFPVDLVDVHLEHPLECKINKFFVFLHLNTKKQIKLWVSFCQTLRSLHLKEMW